MLHPQWQQLYVGASPADRYLNRILERERVDNGPLSPLRAVQNTLMPALTAWGNGRILSVHPSGSFMKGTAVLSGTDIDLFISLSHETVESLQQIHETLFKRLSDSGYSPKRQNVSLNIRVGQYSVDLVPGKRQNDLSLDHSLYKHKTGGWTKTNVATHISTVITGGRQAETRLLKLWRNQKNLDFTSFYIELVVIKALQGDTDTSIASRIQTVFKYLLNSFETARFVDPANTNNVLSDELSKTAKKEISNAAGGALTTPFWENIIR
jgi:hypothetical protein